MVLNVISKQKVVKLVEICEQYLGVTVNTRDELDICLLSSCLVPMRDKQFGPSFASVNRSTVSEVEKKNCTQVLRIM